MTSFLVKFLAIIIMFPLAILSFTFTVILLIQLFASAPTLPPPSCDDIPMSMECV